MQFKMKSSSARFAAFAFPLFAAVARAHPGHDGHEGGDFTWDFSHLASHPVATVACALIAVAALWAGVSLLRSRRASRAVARK
jgi:hydrogenase/urease accessory protein HupE